MSDISWTEQTWNPIVGCSVLSSGCTNCYAMRMAARLEAMGTVPHYDGTTKKVNGNAVWTGKMAQAPDSVLMKPLKRKKPTTYFVNSMSDLFHEDVPMNWIDEVFAVMALSPQHTFQILTKRSERMLKYLQYDERHRCIRIEMEEITDSDCILPTLPLPNVWLGVSAEDQKTADERIPNLLETPAAGRFVSVEPQLENINLSHLHQGHSHMYDKPEEKYIDALAGMNIDGFLFETSKLDWVIQGCESGHGARTFDINWARYMREQCKAAGVPYFLKQSIDKNGKLDRSQMLDGVKHDAMPVGAK